MTFLEPTDDTTGTATITLHPAFEVGTVDPRLFGSFVEHLGRGVYGGLYEPSHVTADEHGFRGDVIDLVKELGVTTVRYPGGNFVSAYDWRDGIGPRDTRPVRLDPAWHSVETNAFGTDEFAAWCRAAGTEPMLAVNLGTGDIRSALQLLEYVNHPSGTTLSDERRANGAEDPYGVRLWCLGNEMDGPWQIGHMTAREYGRLAARTASALRAVDPDLELIVCGSSNDRMATFGTWEQEVLTETIDVVDHISCHQYFRNDGDLPAFLASGLAMDYFIDSVAATIRQVKAATRSTRDVTISFDEWNVWDFVAHDERVREGLAWESAPPLLEDKYTAVDAVVVGDMLISMINRADIVKAASLAQLVNVIGPIVAEEDGPAWRQSIFYPFAAAKEAAGSTALQVATSSTTFRYGPDLTAPSISAAATLNQGTSAISVFVVNRDPVETVRTVIDLHAFGNVTVTSADVLWSSDPLTTNSAAHQDAVSPTTLETQINDGLLEASLPPVSWATIRFQAQP